MLYSVSLGKVWKRGRALVVTVEGRKVGGLGFGGGATKSSVPAGGPISPKGKGGMCVVV